MLQLKWWDEHLSVYGSVINVNCNQLCKIKWVVYGSKDRSQCSLNITVRNEEMFIYLY